MFDPYQTWLGIPPAEQPPTLYRLLGIRAGEKDREVIEKAAMRQTGRVLAHPAGPHAVEAARLLNEFVEAHTILTDAARRRAYDAELAAAPSGVELVPVVPPPLPAMQPEAYAPGSPVVVRASPAAPAWDMNQDHEAAEPLVKASRKRRREESSALPWALFLVVAVLGVAAAGYYLLAPTSAQTREKARKRPPGEKPSDGLSFKPRPITRPATTKEEEPADDGPDPVFATLGDDWKRLFNGKDLAGWNAKLQDSTVPVNQTFTVDSEGLLTFDGVTRGFIESAERYTDFDLHVEYRFPVLGRTEPRYSSAGIGFRSLSDDPFNNRDWLEVSMGLKDLGNFLAKGGEFKTNKSAINPANPDIRRASKQVPPRPGKWNLLELSAVSGKVTLRINNQVVNEGTDAPQVAAPIRLMYRGTAIQFRTIAVKRRE